MNGSGVRRRGDEELVRTGTGMVVFVSVYVFVVILVVGVGVEGSLYNVETSGDR